MVMLKNPTLTALFISATILALSVPATVPAEEASAQQAVDWWLDAALESISEIEDKAALSGASYAVVYPLLRKGRLDEAARIARNVVPVQKRVYAQTAVAKQYLEQRDEAKYLALMQELVERTLQSDKKSPSNFLTSHLLGQFTESGHVAEAIAFAAQLPGKFQQSGAYQKIANGLAKRGKLDEAYQLVDDHSPKEWSKNAAVGIAYEVARAGRVEETETAIKRLEEVEHRDTTYQNLAEALAKVELHAEPPASADQIALAKRYAAKIVDPVMQSKTLAAIATRELRSEKEVAKLESALASAETREQKQAVQQRLFEVFLEQKKVAEAEAMITSMVQTIEATPREPVTSKFGIFDDQTELARAKLLFANTAILLAKQGDQSASQQRLEWATQAFREIPDPAGLVKWPALRGLMDAYIQCGNAEGVQEFIRELTPQATSNFHKSNLAVYLIEAGDVTSAKDISLQIGSDPTTGFALGQIADAYVRAGEFASARELLEKISHTSDDQEAYSRAARGMVEGGQIAELKAWLPKMPTPTARVYACVGAIHGLAQQ